MQLCAKSWFWRFFIYLKNGSVEFFKKNSKRNIYDVYNKIPTCDLHDTVIWLWSTDTLFWRLSLDHNMDVYYQVKHRLQALTLVR